MPEKSGLEARTVAATVLTRVIDDKRGLDGVLSPQGAVAAFHRLDPQDQSLVRAIVTTALRHRGEIEHALSIVMNRRAPKNARHLIHTLHVAAAQILFLDTPDRAAVDLAVTAIKGEKRSSRFASLANAVLRRMSREEPALFSKLSEPERAALNLAPWLKKRIRKSYGRDRLPQIAAQHMVPPLIDVTVKVQPEKWAERLGGVHLFGNSIRVARDGKIQEWPGYDEGEWWVQDAAAYLPAQLLGNIEGKSVADLCAAPGGKTAQLIVAGGNVIALEANASRLARLDENLDRLNLTAQTIHTDLFDWNPETPLDAVLLDAPCSSTGTIRRHPDVQWIKSEDDILELANLQRKMIEQAATFLKPGGTLIFANCSIDRTEGEDVFNAVSKADNDLIADPISPDEVFGLQDMVTGQGTLRTLPCHLQHIEPPAGSETEPARFRGLDGFFAARFVRRS